MSTRSNIAILYPNGSVKGIYCHSDGYPSYNGEILLNHYATVEKVEALMDLGHLSVLGREIGVKHDFNWMDKFPLNEWEKMTKDPRYNMCRAYGRDRGEKKQSAVKFKSLSAALNAFDNDYTYVFNVETSSWLYRRRSNDLSPLTDQVCKD